MLLYREANRRLHSAVSLRPVTGCGKRFPHKVGYIDFIYPREKISVCGRFTPKSNLVGKMVGVVVRSDKKRFGCEANRRLHSAASLRTVSG